jgi:hypothetical protein
LPYPLSGRVDLEQFVKVNTVAFDVQGNRI